MKRDFLKKLFLFLLSTTLSLAGFAQTGSLSGQVVDEKNQPLPGATVQIKTINRGASTDVDGRFTLNSIADGSYSLTVSFVGYQTLQKNVVVKGATKANFKLSPDAQTLGEVVVIGYGTVKKGDVAGAVSTVTSKDFQKGAISSPEQLIVGKVPGVTITSNGGAPGEGSTVRIRGGASLNASNDPLYVIDGVPITSSGVSGVASPFSWLNPNDIESITALKDAAATAIYGSRASNGIILITTKKGQSGKPVVSFSTMASVSTVPKTLDIFTADEFREFVTNHPKATEDQKKLLGDASTDWQKEIYQTATSFDNNLSVSGTYRELPYRVSLGYLHQPGILKTGKLDRTSGAISLTPKFFDNHLKVDLNLKGSVSKSHFANTGAIGAAVMFDPTKPVYAEGLPFGGYYEWMTGDVPHGQSTRNPVALLNQRNDQGQVDRGFGNLQVDYSFHFLPELHANVNLGFDVSKGHGSVFVPKEAAQSWNTEGLNNTYKQNKNNKVLEFYLNYIKDLKEIKSTVNATAGYGYYDYLTKDYFYPSYNAAGVKIENSDPLFPFNKPRNTMISYYGRLIYTLDNKYTLSTSLRTDGSSRFNPDGRWGVFPSAAVTWRVSEEPFLKGSGKVSDMKLRLSYGQTGNQEGFAEYSYLPVYSLSANTAQYMFGETFYNMYRPSAYDKNIKWEKTATYNAGLDYGFLNNRINGTIDVYYKKTNDLLSVVPISMGTNFSNRLLTNVGNIENRGVEFAINANPVRSKDFSWDVGFNVNYNKNKITKLTLNRDSTFIGNPVGDITGATGYNIQIHSVDHPTFTFYTYKQVYNEEGKPLEGVYVDMNKDGVINQKDLYYGKSPFPKFTFGFSTQLVYKKWDFSTSLRANIGNYIYHNVNSDISRVGNIINPLSYLQNATKDVLTTGFIDNQALSDYYMENASFLKMDNVGIGYNAGRVFSNAASLRLSLRCQNVFTVTNYTGLDPEIFGGIDRNVYPRPRIFSLGVNVDF